METLKHLVAEYVWLALVFCGLWLVITFALALPADKE